MSYLQTNIGDLKNELKKLQETTNAQIERLQNLLEKTSSSTFNKLSYADQYNYKQELADTGKFIRNYIRESCTKLDNSAFKILHDCSFGYYAEQELYKKVKIESVEHLSGKEIPFDIFKCIMEDESINQLTKNELIRQRGDKRYKIKEVN
tara:strand:- start:4873 stop:5322 length:450 start_codon:yes stop_codon:yes gene_type:complete